MRRRRPPDRSAAPAVSMPLLNGAPWYVKLVMWLLVWFGFPVVVCIALFMVVIGQIPSPIVTTSAEVGKLRTDMTSVLRFVEVSTRMQRQICRNTSSNLAERVACDQ